MPLSLCFNQNVFQGFSSLQYDMSGGSVKISRLVVVDVFKLGKAWWYCVTKGNILLRASLFFCLSDAFLSLNFTPERCFDPANNGQTGYMNSTSRKYSYCYQNSQWQLRRFQVESKLQSCLRIYILIMAEIPTAGGLWKQAILATKRWTLLSDEKIETRKQSKAKQTRWLERAM